MWLSSKNNITDRTTKPNKARNLTSTTATDRLTTLTETDRNIEKGSEKKPCRNNPRHSILAKRLCNTAFR
jgi:hypothetical protein